MVHVAPMVRCNGSGRNALRPDRIDQAEHSFDLRPTLGGQQDLRTGADERQGLVRSTGRQGAQDVEPGEHGAVFAGSPADEGEDGPRREADDAAVAVEHALGDIVAEAQPVFALLLAPGQFHLGQAGEGIGRHGCSPSFTGK